MTNSGNRNKFIKFVKNKLAFISSILAFLSSIIGFIKLWQGNAELITIILIFFGIIGLFLCFLYVAFKKKQPRLEGGIHLWAFPKLRYFAISGLVIISLVLVLGLSFWIYSKYRSTDKVVVLVANFIGPNPQKWAITEKALENLQKILYVDPNVKLLALEQPITVQEGSDKAKKIGKENKASIVIWGWYAVTEEACTITIHFELLKELEIISKIKLGPYTKEISELQNFSFQTRLSQNLNFLTLFTIGLVRYYSSSFNEANQIFTKALEEKSQLVRSIDLAIIYFIKGNIHFFNNEYDDAIAEYSHMLELYAKEPAAYFNRGITHLKLNDFEKAINDFDKVIGLDSKYVEAYYNRGNAYFELKDFRNAIVNYDKVIHLNTNFINAYKNRGNSYFVLEDFKKAITDFNIVLKKETKEIGTYLLRGIAYYRLGDLDIAINDFSKVLKLNSNNTTAYIFRGIANYDLKNFRSAISDYNRAIELDSKSAEALSRRGLIFTKLKKYESAISDYRKALKFKPNDLITKLNLTEALIIIGYIVAAEKEAKEILNKANLGWHKLIGNYLLAISLKLQDKKTDKVDSDLKNLCVRIYKSSWSFGEIEDWVNMANISEDKKDYIRKKTDKIKKYVQ